MSDTRKNLTPHKLASHPAQELAEAALLLEKATRQVGIYRVLEIMRDILECREEGCWCGCDDDGIKLYNEISMLLVAAEVSSTFADPGVVLSRQWVDNYLAKIGCRR